MTHLTRNSPLIYHQHEAVRFLIIYGKNWLLLSSGYNEVLEFFNHISRTYVTTILSAMSELAGANLNQGHTTGKINYRLCDYNPDTAAPDSDNGCGAHTDYGTFSIIFQDGTPGLGIEDAKQPGRWIQVPGDATIILAGWCTVILTGGCIQATRHRVRRTPGVRRLSAVLFVAPDLDIELKPLEGFCLNRAFSDKIMTGGVDVKWFKDVMGKKWRHREGNEEPDKYEAAAQDEIIEKLVWD